MSLHNRVVVRWRGKKSRDTWSRKERPWCVISATNVDPVQCRACVCRPIEKASLKQHQQERRDVQTNLSVGLLLAQQGLNHKTSSAFRDLGHQWAYRVNVLPANIFIQFIIRNKNLKRNYSIFEENWKNFITATTWTISICLWSLIRSNNHKMLTLLCIICCKENQDFKNKS